jgi:hypothetical protein
MLAETLSKAKLLALDKPRMRALAREVALDGTVEMDEA